MLTNGKHFLLRSSDMNRDLYKRALVAILTGAMLMASMAFANQAESKPPHLRTALGPGANKSARGGTAADKLSMPLKVLYRQFADTRGARSDGAEFSAQQLSTLFGIAGAEKNPSRSEERRVGKECRFRGAPYER